MLVVCLLAVCALLLGGLAVDVPPLHRLVDRLASGDADSAHDGVASASPATLARAQEGAEQLLAAAGLGEDSMSRVVDSIVEAAKAVTESSRPAPSTPPPAAAEEPAAEEPPVSPAPADEASASEPESTADDDGDYGQTAS